MSAPDAGASSAPAITGAHASLIEPASTHRAAVAALAGVAAAAYVVGFYHHQSPLAVSDFDAIWTAARALWARQDPYVAIQSPPSTAPSIGLRTSVSTRATAAAITRMTTATTILGM